MYRVNWLSWGLSFLVFAFLCLLASQAKVPQKGTPVSANEWRLAEPVRYENLSIFPVIGRKTVDTADFATLDESLSAGQVVVAEGGADILRRSRDGHPTPIPAHQGATVNQLVLINRGPKPLLLLAGEMVSGGKQDRIIGKDRIVPPGGAPLPLDVFCVEAGRWTGGAQFTAAQLMVHPSVREQAAIAQEQAKVWDAVRTGTSSTARVPGNTESAQAAPIAGRSSQSVMVTEEALSTVIASEAPTQSYGKIYKSSQVAIPIDTFAEEMQRRFDRETSKLKGEQIVGVVVAYGGEVAWSDIFASTSLFERYWPKLLRSYVVEALTRPRTNEEASLEDARNFLRPIVGHESVETEPAIYSLKEVTEGKYVQVELEALKPQEITLHILRIHRTS